MVRHNRHTPVKDPPQMKTGEGFIASPVSGFQGSVESRYRTAPRETKLGPNRDPMFNRAMAARQQQMIKHRPRSVQVKPPAREVAQPKPAQIVANQPSVAKKSNHSSKKKQNWFSRQRITYAMSVLVFIFGMASATYGYIETQKARDQIAQLTGADGGSVQGETSPGQPNVADLPDETPVTDYDISSYTTPAEDPRYIKIEKLGVMARMFGLGETPEGAVDTPGGIYDVGWYNKSARPGDEKGAMLAVAHYSGLTNLGVFGGLKTLQNDDVIQIEQGNGEVHSFKVVEMTSYDRKSVDMKKALSPVDSNVLSLNLITCGGNFDSEANTYSERLLVRTVRI